MIVGIFWVGTFVLYWPARLLLRALCPLVFSSSFVLNLTTVRHFSQVVLLVGRCSFCLAQSFLGVLQLQELAGFLIELLDAPTFFLLELIPEWDRRKHAIGEMSQDPSVWRQCHKI